MSSSRTLRHGVFLSEAQNPMSPPPLYTVYVYINSKLIHTGKGGGGRVEPQRRGEGQQFSKLRRKHQHDCISMSMNSDKHLLQSPYAGQFFKNTTFLLRSI
jgi:hypothetical protein